MNEGEANKLSDCGYGCNIIGGPWISTNPNCTECNPIEEEMQPKVKRHDARIVQSLENLKAELERNHDTRSKEIWFKINSCLYAEYPVF